MNCYMRMREEGEGGWWVHTEKGGRYHSVGSNWKVCVNHNSTVQMQGQPGAAKETKRKEKENGGGGGGTEEKQPKPSSWFICWQIGTWY